jgi:hypothetical protein
MNRDVKDFVSSCDQC